jgi:hypothetical protein
VGTCVFEFAQGPIVWETFTHAFRVLEYNGPLSYTPGTNTVIGAVHLSEAGVPENSLTGRVDFTKSPQNRFDVLRLEAGAWTNASLQSLTNTNTIINRDLQVKTNYYGYVLFDDGRPETSDPDYRIWVLSINDPNETDMDGIPDFSDDPQAPVAPAPRLDLSWADGRLLLVIRGEVGQNCEIQEAAQLPRPSGGPPEALRSRTAPKGLRCLCRAHRGFGGFR